MSNAQQVTMKKMTNTEFASLPGAQHVDVYITLDYAPGHPTIHHNVRDASVRYVISQYPRFHSITLVRLVTAPASVYGRRCREAAD